jgi:hypothetical protein
METQFYDIASKLDELRGIPKPSQNEISELLQLTTRESTIRYFFHDLNNPDWVEPLYSISWFVNPPDPKPDDERTDLFTLPGWHQGEYLARMASYFPNIIREVAISLETDNARAIRTMLEAILRIPPEIAAETVPSFERWSRTPFARSMMLANEMGLIMEYLAKGGQIAAAFHVLNTLLIPTPIKDKSSEGRIVAGALHDLYWLNEVFVHNLLPLLEGEPIEVIKILNSRLIEAIDLEVDPNVLKEKDPSYTYWRLNIRPDLSPDQPRDFKDLLVNLLIRTLEESRKNGRTELSEILLGYLDSPYVIFKRIAVYLLRLNGNQYPELVEKAYRTWKTHTWAAGQEEFQHFLDAQFGVLPPEIQEEILNSIFQYRDSNEFFEWAEEVIHQSPDRFVGNSLKEKEASFAEEYEFRELHRFAQWLTGDIKRRYEELSIKHEMPPPRPESGVVITSWETEQSPIQVEELGKMTVHEVIKYLVEFVPEGKSFRGPSREGLAQAFSVEVKNRLEEFVEYSSLLIRDDLPFVYHESYFRALEDAIKANQQIRFDRVIDLCEFIVNLKGAKFEKNRYEQGLSQAKLTIAHFLEQFLSTKELYVDNGLLERIGHVIFLLLEEQDDPFLIQEVDNEPNKIDTQTLNINQDAATLSLNSIRGVAMHCIISYAFYSERKRKAEFGNKDNPIMVPLVRDELTAKLDKTQDSSTAVHAVLGWYFPQLMYLDKVWATENLGRIFPLSQELSKYWVAAWSAYVRFSDVYTSVFPHLIDHYMFAIELLPSQKSQAFDRIDERLIEHLLKAYLLALINIDSEDGLLKSFYRKASDEVRAHGNFWLSKVLETEKPSTEDEIWIKTWSLWQWRISQALDAENKDRYQKEVTSFSRLLEYAPVELDNLYSVLSQIIEFKGEDYFEFVGIIDYLAKNAKKHLKYVVGLLLEILQRKRIPYLATDDRNNIRQILEQVKNSDDAKARQQALEIINILGEWGDYEWRMFLDDLQQVR